MVVERKSEDSDSFGKQQIVLQARWTDDSPEEIGRQKFGERRRLNTTDYYILDLDTDEVVSNLPRTVQDRDSMLSTMVAMGSRIYIFGGQIHGDTSAVVPNTPKTRASYYLDLGDHQTGWKRADPPLTDDQLQLHGSVAFGGKMYFFRGSTFSCLCEVFDPQRYQWRRIKSPPGGDGKVNLYITPPVLADYKNNRIIVCFNNISTMYAYYPSEDRWECVVEGFRGWLSYSHPVTLADGVIYVHFRKIIGFVRAFDIATKEWLNVQVSPDAVDNYQSYLHLHTYDVLLHLGNDILCLFAWTYQDHEPEQTQTTSVHVVQFKVELVNNNETKEVLVTPLSSKYYDLGSRCHVLRYLRL